MKKYINIALKEAIEGIQELETEGGVTFLEKAAHLMSDCVAKGGKMLIAGNGGSLAEAVHFAEELTGRYRNTRRPFAAMALADPFHITCTTNDIGFDEIFSRPIEAFGKPEDLFIALTTSGNSNNLIRAIESARARGMRVISLLGKGGGKTKGLSDLEWIVGPQLTTSDRIQEVHLLILHLIIELFEREQGCL